MSASEFADFFNMTIANGDLKISIGDDLDATLCIHPGDNNKTLYIQFDQSYKNICAESGIALTVEDARYFVEILEGFIAAKGVQCANCGQILNEFYELKGSGGICCLCSGDV